MWKWVVLALGGTSAIAFVNFLHLWARHKLTPLGDTHEAYGLLALGVFVISMVLGYNARRKSLKN